MSGLNIQNNSWKGWTSSSISTLFSGFNTTGVNGLSSFVGDYASIKNGSYGKLIKSYYAKVEENLPKKSDFKTSTSKTDKNKVLDSLKEANLTKAEKTAASDAKGIVNAVDKLAEGKATSVFSKSYVRGENGKQEYGYDKDKIYDAVKNFADAYNKTLDATDKLDNDTVERAVSSMLNSTRMNAKALSAVGISVGTDAKMAIDKDTFMKADMDDIKKLFNGTGSYGATVSSKADSISAAVTGNKGYTKTGSYQSNSTTDLFSEYI